MSLIPFNSLPDRSRLMIYHAGRGLDNHQLETLDRNDLRKVQDERLRLLLSELRTNEFYQAKARGAGARLERIQRADIEAIGGAGSGNESKVVSVRGDLKLLESNSAGTRDLGAQRR